MALEPKLLRERLEAVERASVVVAVEDIEIVEVGILAARIFVVAVCGDRSQFGPVEVVDALAGNAPVGDVAAIAAPRRDRHQALERTVLDDRADTALERGNRRRLRAGGGCVMRG